MLFVAGMRAREDMTQPWYRSSAIEPGVVWLSSLRHRILLLVMFATASGLIIADLRTWLELDVATIYIVPLVLAGATRSRPLLWILTAVLITATFIVYAVQIPAGAFALDERFFVNRVLDTVSLLLVAGVLHFWMNSMDAGESQTRLLEEQGRKIETIKLSKRMVEVQEAERQSLASELHDLVGQKLTALSINLNILKNQLLPDQSAHTGPPLQNSLMLVEETTEIIRNVMTELRPAVLDDFGLAPALRWYAGQFAMRTGMATSVREQGAARRLPPPAEIALFRIAQEALANVAKYARAQAAIITLEATAQVVSLIVADDGCGFDVAADRPPARNHGWGLMIMRERAASVGAQLSVESAPGCGTRVIATLRSNDP